MIKYTRIFYPYNNIKIIYGLFVSAYKFPSPITEGKLAL